MRYHQIIWLCLGAVFAANLEAGEIQGRVAVSGSQRSLAGGIVLLNPIRAVQRPDATGAYSFKNIPNGEYEILSCGNEALVQKIPVTVSDSAAQVDFSVIAGDLDQNGQIDLIDLELFAERLGQAAADEPLDTNNDQNLTTDDLDFWYDQSWQCAGHWYYYTLLDDAEHANANPVFPAQGKWQTYHDTGSSSTLPTSTSAVLPVAGGYYSDQSYLFQYFLGSAAQYPFAMIRLLFGDNENVAFDARRFEGFTVVLKGEGQPLVVSLKSAVTSDDWSEYFVKIPSVGKNWQAFSFNFREHFRQPDWGGSESIERVLQTLQAIQFKADENWQDQLFSIRIDNVCLFEKLYQPQTGKISGNLICDQSPLPAVIVELANVEKEYQCLSNLNGAFQLADVEVGRYLLTAVRPGFALDTLAIEILPEQQLNLPNLNMERSIPLTKPVSTGAVRVVGRNLETDFDQDGVYSPFFIKGVGYAPTPIGSSGSLIFPEKVYNRDMLLLAAMNCNAIRTWGTASSLLLDKAQQNGIKVLTGFWVSTSADFFNPTDRLALLADFKSYVTHLQNHPAILAWSLGNEQNYANGDNWAWYSLVEDLAVTAFLVEGEDYHPVASPNGDRNRIGFADYLTRDADLPYLDIWGMNIYKPNREGFQNTFLLYSVFSSKPLWISEYGIDAYDNRNHSEYEVEQAVYAKNRQREMVNSSLCIGSTLMAYSDEWWKAGDPNSHDPGGYPTGDHPDGYSNEEWWGIFRAIKNGNDIDILTKRAIYDTLKVQFQNMSR